MLEDKVEGDKAPKPGLGSPQSSILDFFISPNKGTVTQKQVDLSNITQEENDNGSPLIDSASQGPIEKSADCASGEESADSVILLSDDNSSQSRKPLTDSENSAANSLEKKDECGKIECLDKKEQLNTKEVVSLGKCKSAKTSKQMTLTGNVSLSKAEDTSASTEISSKVTDIVETDSEMVDSKHVEDNSATVSESKKKRKRRSSGNAEKKRSKPDPILEEVPADPNCSASEMSYEAFLQSMTVPGRDADNTSQEKDSQNTDTSEFQETEPIILDDTLDQQSSQKCILSPDLQKEDNSKSVQYVEMVSENKRKKNKSARTSLFSEDKASTFSDAEEIVPCKSEDEKCKKSSILNFFGKVGNPDKEHEVVTITADVHHQPSEVNKSAKVSTVDSSTPLKQKKLITPNSPGVVEIEEDIEIIGSETLDDNNAKKTKSRRKKGERVVKEVPKKDKVTKEVKNKSCDKDEVKDDVNIEKVEVKRTAEVDAFLKSSKQQVAGGKSAQATLSFTKKGLKAETIGVKAEPSTLKTRVRGSSKASSELGEGDDAKKKVKSKKKSNKSEKTTETNNSEQVNTSMEGEETEREKRSRRVRYQVSSLQFDDSRQTPIKMRIRLKNSSGEESDFTPKSAKVKGRKQQKAQKLLEKAKRSKKAKSSKTKSNHNSSKDEVVDLDSSTDGGCRRRSSRLSVQSPPAPIIVDDEVTEEPTAKKTAKKSAKTPLKLKPKDSPLKTKPKDSPLKTKPKDSPLKAKPKDSPLKAKIKNSPRKGAKDSPRKQKGGKLASIFNVGKSKTEQEKPKEPEDPEKVRLRQAFLMSDVPDMLKKKVAVTVAAAQALTEYTGPPAISHVQQKPQDVSEGYCPWSLPPVQLPTRCLTSFHSLSLDWKLLNSYKTICHKKTDMFQEFRFHPELSPAVTDELLGELEGVVAKGFTVRQLFSDMQRKLQEDLQSVDTSADLTDKAPEPTPVEEEVGKKKKGRKSAAEKKKLSLSKAKVEESPAPVVRKIGEMMWSERYQPSHSTEVIGHSAHLTKLKSWLLEWKHRTHKEARKLRLQMLKQSQAKPAVKESDDNAWWGEDDSDFDIDSADSEDEDDGLCNTMLIHGPQGVGKTCSVYALAQELGYKVIEVNAASSRNGKKILSKLQEATQSHQVATSKDGGSSNMLSALSNTMSNSMTDCAKPAKKEVKMPTAFTNLFSKAGNKKSEPAEIIDLDADPKKKQKGDSKSKRKRKREKEEETVEKSPKKAKKDKKEKKLPQMPVKEESSQSGGLELSSTTLILFDEADIYFEDDRGYVPAIQHFMTRTKIPIILTTTDPKFGSQLQARFESLSFKQPSVPMISSHLQTICLVEGVRTCPHEMTGLVRHNQGDIRKCLLWLQYWLGSGGGACKQSQGIRKTTRLTLVSIDENTCSQDSIPIMDVDDDFVVCKPAVSRRRVIDDDESSSSNVFPTEVASLTDTNKFSHLPQVHCLQLETASGVSRPMTETLESGLLSYLKGTSDAVSELQELCQNLHNTGRIVFSQNLYHLLPLPKLLLSTASTRTKTQEAAPAKRSRIRTDLFDDEASNEGETDTETKPEPVPKTSESKSEMLLNLKCLKAFSQYYDSMSSMDLMTSSCQQRQSSKCYLTSIIGSETKTDLDNFIQVEETDSSIKCLSEEADVIVGMQSTKCLYGSLSRAVEMYRTEAGQNDIPDSTCLPVTGGRTTFTLMFSEPRLPGAVRKAHENVADCLPLTMHCNQRVVQLDYLPSLRAVSRAEQLRQISKCKRRFHHYFDHIGLGLKESSLNVLCQTFN